MLPLRMGGIVHEGIMECVRCDIKGVSVAGTANGLHRRHLRGIRFQIVLRCLPYNIPSSLFPAFVMVQLLEAFIGEQDGRHNLSTFLCYDNIFVSAKPAHRRATARV